MGLYMRLKDALGTLFPDKKNRADKTLVTRWTEEADDRAEIPLAEYPRPQLRRAEWTCLNGWWEYAFTRREEPWRGPEGEILVPFSPETSRSAVGKTLWPGEALWYRRELPIEECRPGQRLILHFGAVDERCTVWLNGKRMGRHRGGYLPFSFDITEAARAGLNELLVRVLDDTDEGPACRGKQRLKPGGMFYKGQSGIWQTVWMERVPENYIRKIKITPDLEKGEVEIRVLACSASGGVIEIGRPGIYSERELVFEGADESARGGAWPGGADSAEGGARLGGAESAREDARTGGDDNQADRFSHKVLKPDSAAISLRIKEGDFDEAGRAKYIFRMEDPAYWSPESPVLYPVRIRLGEDEASTYFAMRSFGKGTDAGGHPCLTLNGEPYFFHGVLDQGYWPESLMTAPSDEALLFDIRQMKSHGFNMLRKHIKVESLRWYYHCDRLGMVVWQDMVSGGGKLNSVLCTYAPTVLPGFGHRFSDRNYRLLSREDAKERVRYEEQLLEMIDLLGSEPCIGLWVIFNEGWGQFDSARLSRAARRADPSRLVDHASGWFDHGVGDVRSIHNYYQKLAVHQDPWGRAFVLSEYGGYACCIPGHYSSQRTYGYHNETPETFSGSFYELTEKIRSMHPEGLAAAVYTQVSDIEDEVNGILTYDRKVDKVVRG